LKGVGLRCRDDDEELSWLRDGNNIEHCMLWGVRLRGEVWRVVRVLIVEACTGARMCSKKAGFGPFCSQVSSVYLPNLRTAKYVEPESPVVPVVTWTNMHFNCFELDGRSLPRYPKDRGMNTSVISNKTVRCRR